MFSNSNPASALRQRAFVALRITSGPGSSPIGTPKANKSLIGTHSQIEFRVSYRKQTIADHSNRYKTVEVVKGSTKHQDTYSQQATSKRRRDVHSSTSSTSTSSFLIETVRRLEIPVSYRKQRTRLFLIETGTMFPGDQNQDLTPLRHTLTASAHPSNLGVSTRIDGLHG